MYRLKKSPTHLPLFLYKLQFSELDPDKVPYMAPPRRYEPNSDVYVKCLASGGFDLRNESGKYALVPLNDKQIDSLDVVRHHMTRELDSFADELAVLRNHGYNPIAVTQTELEDTFVFESQQEANDAYTELVSEKKLLDGYFYGRKKFMKVKEELEGFYSTPTDKVILKTFWL